MTVSLVPLESFLEKALEKEHDLKGKEYFAFYIMARKNLIENVLDEIKGRIPDYTDHGYRHIIHVLNNIQYLLFDNGKLPETEKLSMDLSVDELYCLCLSVLFHDTGNLFDREKHNKLVPEIYQFACVNEPIKQRRAIVLQACEAHCGTADDGSKDTLKELDQTHMDGRGVSLKKIAAILRFADELAEGKARTSAFMISRGQYSKTSMIHHEYAEDVAIHIGRHSEIIRVTCTVDLERYAGHAPEEREVKIKQYLEYIYKRIIKLDVERQYARYYCNLLDPFKEISFVLKFWYKHIEVKTGLEPVLLNDLVLPGRITETIDNRNSDYSKDVLWPKLNIFEANRNDI